MNKVTKLALAGVVGGALIFGTTGCSSSCETTCSEKASCKANGECKGAEKCKANGKCKSEAK